MIGFRFFLKSLDMTLVIRNFLIIIICLACSFLNYCLLQIGIRFYVPITVLPIFCSFVFGYRLPAIVVLSMGVIDDAMLNMSIGTFALVYSSVAYLTSAYGRRPSNPIWLFYIFSTLYVAVNFLLFVTLLKE